MLVKYKWLISSLGLIVIIPLCLYYYFKPPYEELVIEKLGAVHRFSVMPHKDDNNHVVLVVDGFSNSGYSVKIDFYYSGGNSGPVHGSETVVIPYGEIKGSWVHDFYGVPGKGRVVITYIPPQDKTGLHGRIKIRAFIN